MRQIKESDNVERWPRHKVAYVKCRKCDLVVRITNWTHDRDEPGYDVEVYIGGVYDWNESKCCSTHEYSTNAKAKIAAVAFANSQIAKLL